MPVTREEVADVLRSAVEQSSSLRRSELIDAAIDNGARSEVVHVPGHLSEARLHRLQDLWGDLADLHVEAEGAGLVACERRRARVGDEASLEQADVVSLLSGASRRSRPPPP